VNVALDVPGTSPLPLLVAALGPAMLALAGRLADGTLTWMTGVETLTRFTVPTLQRAARDAGRPPPRVAAGLPVALARDAAAARDWIRRKLHVYGAMPSYRAMLDREGAQDAADIAIVGDVSEVREQLLRLREGGVTDLIAAPMPVESGAIERTVDFLQDQLDGLK